MTKREVPSQSRREFTPTQAFDMAVTLHRQHRLGEAEQVYRAILKLDPNHFGALHYLGSIASQQGRPQEAEQLIRQALAINPDSAEARNNLGIALAALKRFEEAIPFFESALAIRADTPETHNNLVNAPFELCGSVRMGRISLCRHINLLRKVPCAGPQRLATVVDRFHETDRIGRMELKPSDLILRRRKAPSRRMAAGSVSVVAVLRDARKSALLRTRLIGASI